MNALTKLASCTIPFYSLLWFSNFYFKVACQTGSKSEAEPYKVD
jgi:hypothetical protein